MTQSEIDSKIKTLDELADITARLKQEGRTIVHCHGVFDLLHPGHIRHFEAARQQGDVLVVTITQDRYVAKGPGHPFFNERLRAESIAALESVDYVAVNEWRTAVETIKKLKPDIYCKGSDYADPKDDITGKISEEDTAIRSVGGHIHFTNEIAFSSTKLLNTYFDVFPEDTQVFLKKFRDKYESKDIINHIQTLQGMKALVIGEAIIDEYHYCSPLGKSPKEILIPARFLYEEAFAGGTLAIANHIAGFCDKVDIVTVLGNENTYEEFIREHLKPNITPAFFYRQGTGTIVKRRFVEADILRKLFEVQFMDSSPLPESLTGEIYYYLKDHLADYDIIMVGDYGHGFFSQENIDLLGEKSGFLAINVQTNSANIGFNPVTKYSRADYFCIDEPELRMATHDNLGPVETLASGVAEKLKCRRAVITQGHRGSMVYDKKGGNVTVPVFSREVVDRVGAGDAYFAITSPCMAAGLPSDLVGFIGNAAGALSIRIIGNRSFIEPVDLFKYIATLLK